MGFKEKEMHECIYYIFSLCNKDANRHGNFDRIACVCNIVRCAHFKLHRMSAEPHDDSLHLPAIKLHFKVNGEPYS